MHGFNNGLPMLKSLCRDNDIILVQEHWLQKANLYKIEEIDNNFLSFSISSMNKKAEFSVLAGRPFGGCSILYRKTLSNRMHLMDYDREEDRYITMKFQCKPFLS